jgi:DNA-binding CsgD family transcriptional regulator
LEEGARLARAASRVIASRPSEAEAGLSFTVLEDLLGSELWALDRLTEPRRRALEAALLLTETPEGSPDPRGVALATLEMLRVLTDDDPLTIVIDDIQWVDQPSASALTFAMRRLQDRRVTVIAAARSVSGSSEARELPVALEGAIHHLDVGALSRAALARLLRSRTALDLPSPLMGRVFEASAGNPLFALEICRGVARRGAPAPGEPLPIPADLDGLLRSRITALSRPTRSALLVAASAAAPTSALLEAFGCPEGSLDEANSSGVILITDGNIRFTHPLLVSSVYASAAPSTRRKVHRRLAEVVQDGEARARHLAKSIAGPDAGVAAALRDAASQAERRGAPSSAADLYRLASELTPPEDAEDARTATQMAAWNLFDAGDPVAARKLIRGLLSELAAGPQRANALHSLATMSWNDIRMVRNYEEQAILEPHEDSGLRARSLSELAWVAHSTCDLVAARVRAREAVGLARQAGDGEVLRVALPILAMSSTLSGDPSEDLLDEALQLEQTPIHAEASSAATCMGLLQMWTGDLDDARSTLEDELARHREQGHETACWEILAHLGELEYRAGRWIRAGRLAREAREIALDTGQPEVLSEIVPVETVVAAATGSIEEATERGEEGLVLCEQMGDHWNEIRVRSALGFLELSLGHAAAAHDWIEPALHAMASTTLREPGVFPCIPDAVEASTALGDLARAGELADRLAEQGRDMDRPLARSTAARCQGLVAAARGDFVEAVTLLEGAEADHRLVAQPLELARTLLTLGTVRRRMKKKSSARDAIERAQGIFEQLGAPVWLNRARTELARVGGRQQVSASPTSTEKEVARLVARGHTNREVADLLFMSPHTVDANLRRIFRKLGVRSRTELAARF